MCLSIFFWQYLALYTQQAGHLSSRFEKLIKLLATRLTQKVYSMITFIQVVGRSGDFYTMEKGKIVEQQYEVPTTLCAKVHVLLRPSDFVFTPGISAFLGKAVDISKGTKRAQWPWRKRAQQKWQRYWLICTCKGHHGHLKDIDGSGHHGRREILGQFIFEKIDLGCF